MSSSKTITTSTTAASARSTASRSVLRRATPPVVAAGIYLLPGGGPVTSPSQLVLLKTDPNYNEVWPRAVVPYLAVHGVPEPAQLPWLPNDGSVHAELPAGTPYGLVGT